MVVKYLISLTESEPHLFRRDTKNGGRLMFDSIEEAQTALERLKVEENLFGWIVGLDLGGDHVEI